MAKKSINDLKFDAHNFNDHTAEGMELLEKSITENGYGRSIVVDKNDNIIAGNGVTEIAKSKNAPIKVIETNGNELVVVKRKDLDINELGGVNMALADNAVAQANLHWNTEELAQARDQFGIVPEDWGYLAETQAKETKIKETEKLSNLEYSDIYYEPKVKPNIKLTDCVNLDKFNAKIKALDEYNLTEEQKETLKMFAYRFIRIDFEQVANYYAFNASEEEKKAIERLRLVLTDNSINGFINDDLLKVAKTITDFASDREDEE